MFFFVLHDKHFETDEKVSCRIDNRLPNFLIQSINCYDELTGVNKSIFFFLVFFLEKTAFDLLVFVHYNVIQLSYFWQNYFLNNLSLLDGLLRLVCLLVVHQLHHDIIDKQNVGTFIFWWHIISSNSFYIASHGAIINYFFWTSFLFLQTFLLITSISFCFDPWIFCQLPAS